MNIFWPRSSSYLVFPPLMANRQAPAMEQLAAYNKPDREKVLYAGAKTEGKVTW